MTLADRFWPKVDVRGPDECWPWRRAHSHHPVTGRGMIQVGGAAGSKVPAPRVAYYLTHGVWPTLARHTCDSPPCCNPAHIVDGSQADNMQDCLERGRFNHGSRGRPGGNAKVTPEQVREIRKRHAAGDETYTSLASEYGVSNVQIKNIVTRKSWDHVH